MDVATGFQVSPAQCWCCATGDQSLVRVDLGDYPLSVKRFRVYICEHCVTAMAKKVADLKGQTWVSHGEAEKMRFAAAENANLRIKLEAAEAKLADLAEFARDL